MCSPTTCSTGYGSRAPIGGACARAPTRPCYAASPRASPGSSSWTSPSRRPSCSTPASSTTTFDVVAGGFRNLRIRALQICKVL
ncbi:hypothetical protein DAI22_03g412900 [Oryza sativa Japonica Group]|nr:hypothetical protein DAI22_03g412900 [Oryza sativa Japonica Group]